MKQINVLLEEGLSDHVEKWAMLESANCGRRVTVSDVVRQALKGYTNYGASAPDLNWLFGVDEFGASIECSDKKLIQNLIAKFTPFKFLFINFEASAETGRVFKTFFFFFENKIVYGNFSENGSLHTLPYSRISSTELKPAENSLTLTISAGHISLVLKSELFSFGPRYVNQSKQLKTAFDTLTKQLEDIFITLP